MKCLILGWHLQVLVAALMFAKVISKLMESKQKPTYPFANWKVGIIFNGAA